MVISSLDALKKYSKRKERRMKKETTVTSTKGNIISTTSIQAWAN